MKKYIQKISILLQYVSAAFLVLLTFGAFATSAMAGIILLISALVACPFTRNKGVQLIDKIWKEKSPTKKIKGWMYAVTSFVLMLIAIGCTPTSENTDIPVIESESEVLTEIVMEEETSVAELVEEIAEIPEETTDGIITETLAPETESKTISCDGPADPASDMEVHFIDVGQGDATLVKADGKYMLIDAGDNSKGTAVQNYLKKQGVKKLDYLILTHTDADHIGGADVIITKFDVDTLFIGDFKKENKTYEELINAINYKGLQYSTPAVGNEYTLGNAVFTILAPNTVYDDPNNSSIAILLRNGDNRFLFTGDCEEEAETDILANGMEIDCDVYKVGHHGSKTASCQEFLKEITPMYAIISCAQGNTYGHPHAETLNNLRSMGVKVFRTDEQGSIVAYSDGIEITWNCAPSDTWQAGEPDSTTVKKETVKPVEAAQEINATVPQEKPKESLPVAQEPVIEEPVVETQTPQAYTVIGNKNTKAFHRESCSHLPKEKNRVYFNSREEALSAGYDNPCDYCCP